ncbi:MAG: GTPase [Blautia sp.]|nr:GTPase [Blautia sp.]
MDQDYEIPIYLIAGFLDSGKTTFLQFTLEQEYFRIDGKTLLIVCEEGEEEYNAKKLARYNTVIETIGSQEELTKEKLAALEMIHQPERVVMEYNGMWLVSHLEQMDLPEGWAIDQHIVCVDASTFQVYMKNMKSLFMDMVRNADMVVFNRCDMTMPLANFRRSIKVVNPAIEVVFETQNGEIQDIFQDSLPYDLDAPVIELPPEDYGIWFVDANEHPDVYIGKKVHFQGRVHKSDRLAPNCFVPGRPAMTCCADDVSFLGFLCESEQVPHLFPNAWVDVTAKVSWEKRREYRGESGIVLRGEKIVPCEPLAQEMVYFN